MYLLEYVKKLEELGELKTISEEVDWNLEAAAICTLALRSYGVADPDRGAPAILFKKVRGSKESPLLGEPYAGGWRKPWRRFAIAFGLDPNIPYRDWARWVLSKVASPIKPVMVAGGPVKEEVHVGKDVDLLEFPWPYIHEGDGGRYIDLDVIAAKHPTTDWVNWSNYRVQIYDRRHCIPNFTPGQQTADIFYREYEAKGNNMPANISIAEPALNAAAAFPLPPFVNECDLAGAFRGSPVELTKAETSEVPVPAYAELNIEVEVLKGTRVPEGPFGEFIGYIHGTHPRPLARVLAITHRKGAIIPFTVEGVKPNSSQAFPVAFFGPALMAGLLAKGYPVTAAAFHPVFTWANAAIATKVPYPGYQRDAADAYFAFPAVPGHIDTATIVDEDVDPSDIETVLEEIALKVHPKRDIHRLPMGPRVTLNVYYTPEERSRRVCTKTWFDATSKDWDEEKMGPRRLVFDLMYPSDLKERVSKQAEKYLKEG
jgi:4-hydroxy-3-polyprenylbenzoate decarboxylase